MTCIEFVLVARHRTIISISARPPASGSTFAAFYICWKISHRLVLPLKGANPECVLSQSYIYGQFLYMFTAISMQSVGGTMLPAALVRDIRLARSYKTSKLAL